MKKLILLLLVLTSCGKGYHKSELKITKGIFIKSTHYYINDQYLYVSDSNGISETRLIEKGNNYDIVKFRIFNDTLQIKKSCLIGGDKVELHDSVIVGYKEFLDDEELICRELISVWPISKQK
jgi:hypothetical protein